MGRADTRPMAGSPLTNTCPCGAPLIGPARINLNGGWDGTISCQNRHRWEVLAGATATDGSLLWELGEQRDRHSDGPALPKLRRPERLAPPPGRSGKSARSPHQFERGRRLSG